MNLTVDAKNEGSRGGYCMTLPTFASWRLCVRPIALKRRYFMTTTSDGTRYGSLLC